MKILYKIQCVFYLYLIYIEGIYFQVNTQQDPPKNTSTPISNVRGNTGYRVPNLIKICIRTRRRWGDNNGMDLREIGWEDVEWIHLAQDQWRAVVITVVGLFVLYNAGSDY
jgi:hypothetical protein